MSDETLALDVIDSVGPTGHFLTEPHTVEHFRKETWIPKLIDRNNFQTWEEQGKTTLLDRANRRLRQILDTHHCQPLDASLLKELEKLANKDNTPAEAQSAPS